MCGGGNELMAASDTQWGGGVAKGRHAGLCTMQAGARGQGEKEGAQVMLWESDCQV